MLDVLPISVALVLAVRSDSLRMEASLSLVVLPTVFDLRCFLKTTLVGLLALSFIATSFSYPSFNFSLWTYEVKFSMDLLKFILVKFYLSTSFRDLRIVSTKTVLRLTKAGSLSLCLS